MNAVTHTRRIVVLASALGAVATCAPAKPVGPSSGRAPASATAIVAPLPRAAPSQEATPPTPPPVVPAAARGGRPPTWRGDPCHADAGCAWDDPCVPSACVGVASPAPSAVCDESAPAPGICTCVDEMCTLRPDELARLEAEPSGCKSDADCFVDLPTGRCFPQGQTAGPIIDQGPYCACRVATGRCEPAWQEPVECRDWRDCSWTREGRARAVSARTRPRPVARPVKPCADAEHDSVCTEVAGAKVCRLVGWRC
jgi:hypothetical protein